MVRRIAYALMLRSRNLNSCNWAQAVRGAWMISLRHSAKGLGFFVMLRHSKLERGVNRPEVVVALGSHGSRGGLG